MKRIFILVLPLFSWLCSAQFQCPRIENPLNGATNVAVDTEVSWNRVGGIDGYSVSLGRSPGASDILNSRSAALVNFLVPAAGLPDDTKIYVTISLFLEDGTFITCPTESFTTVDVTTPPGCTNLSSPIANVQNVKLGENLAWTYSPTATGYRLAMGSSKDNFNILPETDVGNVLRYDPPENLPENSEIFVKLTPYNENGDTETCIIESFMTGGSNIDCELFRPATNIPETIGLCRDDSEIIVSSDDVAQGFRWYQVTEDGSESLISETRTVTVSDIGQYRYVAYNDLSIFGDNAECASSAYFWVVPSEVATVEAIEVNRDASGINLTVLVSGAGNYEFSLDEKDGPFQDGNVFLSVSEGDHLIYVRDKNGCGTIEYIFIQTITKGDFPKFFTPNGDGVNDYWQFSPLYDTVASLDTIDIFDRYGKLLVQLSPESRGWDGTFKGKPLPSSTFWYMAVSKNGDEVQGYFALKR